MLKREMTFAQLSAID